MDEEDPLIFGNPKDNSNNEEVKTDDGTTTSTKSCLTQSPSFLVPKIDLATSNSSLICKGSFGAMLPYGLISSASEQEKQEDLSSSSSSSNDQQELFFLDQHHLPSEKGNLNPMAKEFVPNTLSNYLPTTNYSCAAAGKVSPTRSISAPPPFSRYQRCKAKAQQINADQKLVSRLSTTIENGSNVLVLMRGCPGSGKTTLAKQILHSLDKSSKKGCILSTDDYFEHTGCNYQYDSAKLPAAHSLNQTKAKNAMSEKINLIIIDNTNLTKWEMSPYVILANENNYQVELIEPNTSWKFKARGLFDRNVHKVKLPKIQDMLSRYEKNVTVEDMLPKNKKNNNNSSSGQREHSLEIDRNDPKLKKKPRHRKKHRVGQDKDPNNNDFMSRSSPDVLQSLDFSDAKMTTDICQDPPSFESWSKDILAASWLEGHTEQQQSEIDCWGFDDWCEPLDQRLPKQTPQSCTDKAENSDSDNSLECLKESFDLCLNENLSKVPDLADLAIKCLESLGEEEIIEKATEAVVQSQMKKDVILMQCFRRKISTMPCGEHALGPDQSYNSLESLPSIYDDNDDADDLADVSKEEHQFYVNFPICSNFVNLLSQMFGQIDELEKKKVDEAGNINLKLNYDDLKCLHETMLKICVKKDDNTTNVKKPKKKFRQLRDDDFQTRDSTGDNQHPHQPEPLTKIMQEQEESLKELKEKVKNKDKTIVEKLKKICSEFPGYDASAIEDIFKQQNFNVDKTLEILHGYPLEHRNNWSVTPSAAPRQQIKSQTIVQKKNGIINLKWLKVVEQDQTEVVEFYSERLKHTMKNARTYIHFKAAGFFQKQLEYFKKKLMEAEMNLLKQNISYLITSNNYNKIDLHGMNKREAGYILRECLKDYKEAYERSNCMKKHLIFVTGKGTNSKNNKPVLKPYLIHYLESRNYRYEVEDGQLKVKI